MYKNHSNSNSYGNTTEDSVTVFNRRFGSWFISINRQFHSPAMLSKIYDSVAVKWDGYLRRLGYPNAYEKIFRTIFLAQPKLAISNLRVLDCGLGTGALSLALNRISHKKLELHGIDLSPHMLRIADHYLRQTGVNFQLSQSNVCQLPYPDNCFDLVMGAHVLEHIVNPEIALQEMIRILKPGGTLLLILTQQSLFATAIRIKWRTHGVSLNQVNTWFHNSGLYDFNRLYIKNAYFFNQFSLASIAKKI